MEKTGEVPVPHNAFGNVQWASTSARNVGYSSLHSTETLTRAYSGTVHQRQYSPGSGSRDASDRQTLDWWEKERCDRLGDWRDSCVDWTQRWTCRELRRSGRRSTRTRMEKTSTGAQELMLLRRSLDATSCSGLMSQPGDQRPLQTSRELQRMVDSRRVKKNEKKTRKNDETETRSGRTLKPISF